MLFSLRLYQGNGGSPLLLSDIQTEKINDPVNLRRRVDEEIVIPDRKHAVR